MEYPHSVAHVEGMLLVGKDNCTTFPDRRNITTKHTGIYMGQTAALAYHLTCKCKPDCPFNDRVFLLPKPEVYE